MNLRIRHSHLPRTFLLTVILAFWIRPASAADVYSTPILFPPQLNDINLTSPQIKWDISNGERLNLGGLIMPSSSISAQISNGKRDDYPWSLKNSSRRSSQVYTISFSWPNVLTRLGRVQFVDMNDNILWAADVDQAKRDNWATMLKEDQEDDKFLSAHRGSEYGEVDVDPATIPIFKSGQPFRFCIYVSKEAERLNICSRPYKLARRKGKLEFRPLRQNVQANVHVQNEAVGDIGIVNYPGTEPLEVKIFYADGTTLQFKSKPIQIKLVDVIKDQKGDRIFLTGEGPKPISAVRYLYIPAKHFWSATGRDEQEVWQMEVAIDHPTLRVVGAWNIPFTYLLTFKDLPSQSDRAYLREHTTTGTYSRMADLYGQHPNPAGLTAPGGRVRKRSKNFFNWSFPAKQRGEVNTAQLLIPKSGSSGNWIGSHRLFRGFPFEVSGRLTTIVAANLETVLLGEVAGSKWFENFGSSHNYYLTHQRWGISTRYFRALQAVTLAGSEVNLSRFSVLNTDIKYNVLPGLWNRDELFGLIASLQFVDLAGVTAPLAGIGVYWARTMPKIFDDLFNLFWFFRYPKYVDMEFITYNFSLTSDVEPIATYYLNFHGKVFWSERVYGEAGFGLKQFGYNNYPQDAQVAIGMLYGTVGLGFIF